MPFPHDMLPCRSGNERIGQRDSIENIMSSPTCLLLVRLHIVQGARLVTVAGVYRRLSSVAVIMSSSVTLHSGPAGGFTRVG